MYTEYCSIFVHLRQLPLFTWKEQTCLKFHWTNFLLYLILQKNRNAWTFWVYSLVANFPTSLLLTVCYKTIFKVIFTAYNMICILHTWLKTSILQSNQQGHKYYLPNTACFDMLCIAIHAVNRNIPHYSFFIA